MVSITGVYQMALRVSTHFDCAKLAAISSFFASNGSRVDRVAESEAVVAWLGRNQGEVVNAVAVRPLNLAPLMLRSDTELIPPLPPGADFSAVLDEEFQVIADDIIGRFFWCERCFRSGRGCGRTAGPRCLRFVRH